MAYYRGRRRPDEQHGYEGYDQHGEPLPVQDRVPDWTGPPVPAQWMTGPPAAGPPSLQYLAHVDQVLVHQQVELLEALTNWQTNNRYQIKNSMGQPILFAHEDSATVARQICGSHRGFVIHITDNNEQEVMRVSREFKCCAGCCWCADSDGCALEITVEAPVGNVVGFVRQTFSLWPPAFSILDSNRTELLSIDGPCCICEGSCFTWDRVFDVTNRQQNAHVGQITKQWSGLIKEWYTQADNFTVNFPMDMDIRVKAIMIGAVFLIDFMYFEQRHSSGKSK